jgi:hypothetical protein
VNWTAVVVALFVAGYYTWHADHVRLVPKLRVKTLHCISTPTNTPLLQRKFIQILVGCGSEGSLQDCRGQLLRVLRWSDHNENWEPTQIDELFDLFWSKVDQESVTIESEADRRLNIFFAQSDWTIAPRVGSIPLRLFLQYSPGTVLRFDVRFAAQDCPAECRSVKVSFGQAWDDIVFEEIPADAHLH